MYETVLTIWCKGCGIEITWGAYVVEGCTYCCKDCFDGIPCHCGDRMEFEDDRRTSQVTTQA
jgi:hypothetical protein